jgi:hypothetical protein
MPMPKVWPGNDGAGSEISKFPEMALLFKPMTV